MTTSEVHHRVSEGVAIITLDAPDRRNALTVSMAEGLIAACDRVDEDERVGAVVITGEGGAFCAGAHRDLLSGVARDPASDQAFHDIGRIYEAFGRVGRLRPPTIAAVVGAAVGAGLNLALATDLRIVATDAQLISGFLPLGVHPGGGHFGLLARTANREAASAMGLFGRRVDGRTAVDKGIAWEAPAAENVLARATELAETVASRPELSRLAARSFRLETDPPGMSWQAATQLEQSVQMWSLRTGPLGVSDEG